MFKGFFISDDLAVILVSFNVTWAVGNKYMFLPKVGNKFNGSLFDGVTGSAVHTVSYAQGLPGDSRWYRSAIAQGLPDNSCQLN